MDKTDIQLWGYNGDIIGNIIGTKWGYNCGYNWDTIGNIIGTKWGYNCGYNWDTIGNIIGIKWIWSHLLLNIMRI